VTTMASVPAGDRYEALLELVTGTARLLAALARTRLLVVAGINAGAGLGVLLAEMAATSEGVGLVDAFADRRSRPQPSG
jgi:hypothetical protein